MLLNFYFSLPCLYSICYNSIKRKKKCSQDLGVPLQPVDPLLEWFEWGFRIVGFRKRLWCEYAMLLTSCVRVQRELSSLMSFLHFSLPPAVLPPKWHSIIHLLLIFLPSLCPGKWVVYCNVPFIHKVNRSSSLAWGIGDPEINLTHLIGTLW